SEVHNTETDHDCRCSAQPATRGRARDSEVRGDGHVAGAVDEISKAVVVALLRAGVGMGMIIGRFLTPLNSLRTTGVSEPTWRQLAAKCRMSVGTAWMGITRITLDPFRLV